MTITNLTHSPRSIKVEINIYDNTEILSSATTLMIANNIFTNTVHDLFDIVDNETRDDFCTSNERYGCKVETPHQSYHKYILKMNFYNLSGENQMI